MTPLEQAVTELAALSEIAYEAKRKDEAKRLGVRVSVLDQAVRAARAPAEAGGQGRAVAFETPEPWPEAVKGTELAAEIRGIVTTYVALSDHAADAVTLWTLHAHVHDELGISPILAAVSPLPRCGKTTLLHVLGGLTPRPLSASSLTESALFRVVEAHRPTLLIDEADTFLDSADGLRGALNSGHTRRGCTLRVEGDSHEVRAYSTWAPKAIALIGRLPPTLADRAIVIPMRRRAPGEHVERLRLDDPDIHLVTLRRCLAWAEDEQPVVGHYVRNAQVPAELHDRAADNWRPLLGIAELIGGDWPERARAAAKALSAPEADDESLGVMLLADIRAAFESGHQNRLTNQQMIDHLVGLDERPWCEMPRTGKAMTKRQLANRLRPFGIAPGTIRIGDSTHKGYLVEWFKDAFARYLPSQIVTTSQASNDAGFGEFPSVTPPEPVTDGIGPKAAPDKECDVVTDRKGGNGADKHSEPPETFGPPAQQARVEAGLKAGYSIESDEAGEPVIMVRDGSRVAVYPDGRAERVRE